MRLSGESLVDKKYVQDHQQKYISFSSNRNVKLRWQKAMVKTESKKRKFCRKHNGKWKPRVSVRPDIRKDNRIQLEHLQRYMNGEMSIIGKYTVNKEYLSHWNSLFRQKSWREKRSTHFSSCHVLFLDYSYFLFFLVSFSFHYCASHTTQSRSSKKTRN